MYLVLRVTPICHGVRPFGRGPVTPGIWDDKLITVAQLLESDLLIPQIKVTFSAPTRSLMGQNEVTLKNLGY